VVIHGILSRSYSGDVGKNFVQMLKHYRGACRSWAKRLLPLAQWENDTKILIEALDLLEEQQKLNSNEQELRRVAIQSLHNVQAEKLAYWRQCFNVRLAVEWDENSRFFHAAASGRHRCNCIAVLDSEDGPITSHGGKSTILHNFYLNLLGRSHDVSWHFDLQDLYPQLDLAS